MQTKKSPRKEMTSLYQRMLTFMVRVTGLEPAHRLTLEPKSSASANSATPAYLVLTLNFYTARGAEVEHIA